MGNYAIAQEISDDPGPDGPETPDVQVDNPVPIDGGAGILVAAGLAYGLKKVYDKRKQNKESEAA